VISEDNQFWKLMAKTMGKIKVMSDNRENGMEERSDEDTSDCGGTTSHSVSNGSEESEDDNEESLNTGETGLGKVPPQYERRT
jgi:hypothetical protein